MQEHQEPTIGVLVVEDEPVLASVLGTYLERSGYRVLTCHEGTEALRLAALFTPEVIILDLGLPGMDGVEVCRRVREFSDCYIVMLTARADEASALEGLSAGADDYITKPFRARELLARVAAMLRRPRGSQRPEDGRRSFGGLTIAPSTREAWVDGLGIDLTRTEFAVLEALSADPDRAHTRRELIDRVWGPSWVGDDHLVDVHVAQLRRKLRDEAAAAKFIVTVRGVGYRMGRGW